MTLHRVRVVGTGLIGTSVGLALSRQGLDVRLVDPSPTAMSLARDLGAGRLDTETQSASVGSGEAGVDLVVVAAPPDVAGRVVVEELGAHPEATVTDVASVKASILAEVLAAGVDTARYVGSHPMAGRERSGAIAGAADLFEGRPWVVVPHPGSAEHAVADVEELARRAGSAVTRMPAAEHDAAVAAVSHVPQVAASVVAARLRELPTEAVALAGQGLRDVTRIAASDPTLWTQILGGNAGPVADLLEEVVADLDGLTRALRALAGGVDQSPGGPADAGTPGGVGDAGARAVLAALVADGNAGHARIPGKHNTRPTTYAVVTVVVPDRPGSLARLMSDIGDEEVNIEDLRIEHGFGRSVGIVDVSVLPAVAEHLRERLGARGWTVQE